MKEVLNKVVFVTGVSSGIGLELVKKFIKEGCTVYGVSRKEVMIDGLNHITLDITDADKVNEVINEIIAKEGKIDIAINNAGMGISGPVENAQPSEIKRIMDVNFLGAVNVVKACLPHMRKAGQGRIMCVSSVASYVPLPFQAFYSASKSALDTFVDATRSEVKAFGVQIFSVHPGDVKTGFTDARAKEMLAEDNPYSKTCNTCVGKMEHDEQNGMTAEYVASKCYKIAVRKRYKLRNVIGGKYKFFTFALKLLPRRLREWAVRTMYF